MDDAVPNQEQETNHPSHAQVVLGLDPEQPLRKRYAALVAEHKPVIAEALGVLERGLKELAEAVRHASFGVVFEPRYDSGGEHTGYVRLSHGPSLLAAARAYETIELSPSQPANMPLRCVGAVGVVDLDTLDLAVEVNRRKAILKEALCRVGPHHYLATVHVDGQTLVRKLPLAIYVLRQLRDAAFNRLGAYRQIPLVATPPDARRPPTLYAIGFSEQWVKSQPRATLDQLIALENAANRLERVELLQKSGIPANEFLYEPKPHYLRMRTHYTTAETPASRVDRAMAELPLLFFRGPDARRWPRVTPPRPRSGSRPRHRQAPALENLPVPGAPSFFRRQDPSAREYAEMHES